MLRSALDTVFGQKKLGEAKTRLVIPAISASTGDLYLYKTPHHERLKTDYRQAAVEVALATSAAPTYFPVHRTPAGMQLMDGGLWANNPVMVAVVEAISLLGVAPSDIRTLSVGCTGTPMAVKPPARRGGLKAWAPATVDWLIHGQSVSAIGQAGLVVGRENLFRVQHVVEPGIYGLDDTAAAVDLEGPGRESARQWLPKIEEVFFATRKQPYTPLYRAD